MNLIKYANIISDMSQDARIAQLRNIVQESDQILLIGNGGSNAIASHIAVDYVKFMGKRSIANDSTPLITMLVNDYGSDEAYAKFVEYHNQPKTTAIIISSSGNSKNCLRAAEAATELGMNVVLLSGFTYDNKLNTYNSDSTKLKYWVDSSEYGVVEMAHHTFLHAIL